MPQTLDSANPTDLIIQAHIAVDFATQFAQFHTEPWCPGPFPAWKIQHHPSTISPLSSR